MKSIKVGDRVILIEAPDLPSKQAPIWNSVYSCVGTVMGLGSLISIGWDNGIDSSFYLRRLKLYKEINNKKDPNLAFRLKKMGVK